MSAFLRLCGLLLVAILIAQVNDWHVLDRVALAVSAVLICAYLWSRISLRGLTVVRRVASDRAQVGQPLREQIAVLNRGWLAKLWVEVRDVSTFPNHRASRVIHVRGRGRMEWIVETICARRGRYHLGPLRMRSGDPFGLFPASLTAPTTVEVVVYPAAVDVTGFPLPLGQLTGGVTSNRRTPFLNASVSGIREYVPGDAYNRISWSATARQNRLMVKEFDEDPTADVWIVLDLDQQHSVRAMRPPTVTMDRHGQWPIEAWLDATEEYAVTIAASLAHRSLDLGRSVGMIASGAHYEVLPSDRSDRQYLKMLEALAVVQADGPRSLAEVLVREARRFTKQSTLLVITSSTDESWVRALAEIAARRVRAAAILVEPETFGEAPSSLMVVSGLLASGIPTHLVKYGEPISAALAASGAVATGMGSRG
ncbi:MAG: DUF58 domain-containing protein [Thermomicrobiales bacterium]